MDSKPSEYFESNYSGLNSKLHLTNNLMSDMHLMLKNEIFSDVSLHCGTEIIRAHKNILSARSPVFSAMFLNPMIESQQDFVVIQGMEPSTLRAMLKYIYCCKTEPLDISSSCKLLSAADMYQLPDLKRVCIEFLRHIMNEENVLYIIRVADLYDDALRAEASNFICREYDSIETHMDWKALQADKPHLVIEIMALKINSLKCEMRLSEDYEMKLVPENAKRKRHKCLKFED